MSSKVKDILLITSYILLGVLTRTVWHVAPNVEFVTALSIAGAYFVRRKYSFSIPLGIMVITDFILGNSPVFLFTWSAFGVAHLAGKILSSKRVENILRKLPNTFRMILLSETAGLVFTLFFYLWTNFGVVVVSNLYPKTLEGVLLSYKMGLPFLLPQLIGNLIIVPAVFVLTEIVYSGKVEFIKKMMLGKIVNSYKIKD
jgi:hypothetical protein